MDQEPLLFRVQKESNVSAMPSKALVQLPGEYRVKGPIHKAEIFEAADIMNLNTAIISAVQDAVSGEKGLACSLTRVRR